MRSVFLLCALATLTGSPSVPQGGAQHPADAAEISRDLLFQPALSAEDAEGKLLFRAPRFTYRFDPARESWEVRPEASARVPEILRTVIVHRHAASGTEFRFKGGATEDEGILEIYRAAEVDPAERLTLWNRQRLARGWIARLEADAPGLTEHQLAEQLEVAEPEVAGVVEDDSYLWLAIRYYAGEGVLGTGTVVRVEVETGKAETYQPPELATSSVTQIVAAGDAFWLGTLHQGEGTLSPGAGLMRFDPAKGEVRSLVKPPSPMASSIVTALAAQRDTLWAATDGALCRIALPAEDAKCWVIVPSVRLDHAVPVADRPGGPPRGRLPAGLYEVRWANAAFLEVVTPDAMEGWLAADDFEEYTRRDFDLRPYELGNTYGGGAGVMRLLGEPGSDPLAAAQAYRVALEPLDPPSEQGWQRVRAPVGWIRRAGQAVVPVLRPAPG